MIRLDDVTVSFRDGWFSGRFKALDQFSLEVESGDIFGLLGPNGAGKSTALYCMLGLLRPDAGNIQVLGQSPHPGSSLFHDVVYLPEEPHYPNHLTVGEAIRFYGDLYNGEVTPQDRESALSAVDMLEYKNRRLSKCSKGMKQRLGLASCLMKSPDLLFLDEPTRGLDPVIGRRFRERLLEMNRNGTTIFLNSHVLTEVEMICNRVAIVQKGKVVVEDRLEQVLDVDAETYRISMDPVEDVPAYLGETARSERRIEAECPREHAGELFDFAEREHVTIYECSLFQRTLEDVFIETVGEEAQQ